MRMRFPMSMRMAIRWRPIHPNANWIPMQMRFSADDDSDSDSGTRSTVPMWLPGRRRRAAVASSSIPIRAALRAGAGPVAASVFDDEFFRTRASACGQRSSRSSRPQCGEPGAREVRLFAGASASPAGPPRAMNSTFRRSFATAIECDHAQPRSQPELINAVASDGHRTPVEGESSFEAPGSEPASGIAPPSDSRVVECSVECVLRCGLEWSLASLQVNFLPPAGFIDIEENCRIVDRVGKRIAPEL